jgi:hypothetical protein
MRPVVLTTLLAVALSAPQIAGADPIQPQTMQSAVSAPAPASATAGSATTPAGSAGVQEVVKITSPPAPDYLDEIECRILPPTTGTRLGGSRECRTVREWKTRQQQSQDMLERTEVGGSQKLRSLTKAN